MLGGSLSKNEKDENIKQSENSQNSEFHDATAGSIVVEHVMGADIGFAESDTGEKESESDENSVSVGKGERKSSCSGVEGVRKSRRLRRKSRKLTGKNSSSKSRVSSQSGADSSYSSTHGNTIAKRLIEIDFSESEEDECMSEGTVSQNILLKN